MNARRLAGSVVTGLACSIMLAAPANADLIAHPAHVHTGSCTEVGDIVANLEDVVGEATPTHVGSEAAILVEASATTDVPISYAHLLEAPHSLVVHLGPSDEYMQVYLVCGDIGGFPLSATDLAIGLGEIDGSGYHGIATIHDDGDSATVDIDVYIAGEAPQAVDD
jgi:hypothetical protein